MIFSPIFSCGDFILMYFCHQYSSLLMQKTLKTANAMAQTAMTIRIDNQQKAMFDKLCEQFGMSANTAINIFVRAVIRSRSIPFPIAADPETDVRTQAIQAFREIRKNAEERTEPEMTLEEINAEINAVRETKPYKA